MTGMSQIRRGRSWAALPALCGIALAVLAGAARAESVPNTGPADPRVRWAVYNPDQVYKLIGVMRSSITVEFAPDETVSKGGGGDTVGWEMTPVGNVLFLKPREAMPPTNLTVLSRRPDGSFRLYAFELSVREGGIGVNDRDTVFKVRFRYPDDEAAAQRAMAAAATAARSEAAEEALVSDRLAAGALSGARNWAYTARGDAELEPEEVSDNGRLTVLRFSGNQPLPSIYEVDGDGAESLVPTNASGRLVTVHKVAKRLRLRRDARVLDIANMAYDARGTSPGTGTVAPDVRRESIYVSATAGRAF